MQELFQDGPGYPQDAVPLPVASFRLANVDDPWVILELAGDRLG